MFQCNIYAVTYGVKNFQNTFAIEMKCFYIATECIGGNGVINSFWKSFSSLQKLQHLPPTKHKCNVIKIKSRTKTVATNGFC